MNIELTGENKKIRFVDNYGDSYDAEVSYDTTTKELQFRCDYTDVELHIPFSLFYEVYKNTWRPRRCMELKLQKGGIHYEQQQKNRT